MLPQLALSDDSESVEKFLRVLDPAGDAVFHIEAHIKGDGPDTKSKLIACTAERFHKYSQDLSELNRRGYGIYVAANSFSDRRGKKNLKRVRGVWADLDHVDDSGCEALCNKLEPTIKIQTSPGKYHLYWLLKKGESLIGDECERINKEISKNYGADVSATDSARLLRLPYFYHMKDPSNPHYVYGTFSDCKYTARDLKNAFGVAGDISTWVLAEGASALLDDGVTAIFAGGYILPDSIQMGQRNVELLRYAGHLRGRCLSQSDIEEKLSAANDQLCVEPLERSELMSVARRYQVETSTEPAAENSTEASSGSFSSADIANGQLFAAMWRGRLLFIHDTGRWLRFENGTGWVIAEPSAEDSCAKEVVAQLAQLAAKAYAADPQSTLAKKLMARVERVSRAVNLRAMIDMAKSEPNMGVRLSAFDSDHWKMGVQNGVLDLKTGALLSSTPDLMVLKRSCVTYDSAAGCPRFEQYLQEVVPDEDCQAFLQRWCGYLLTGEVTEQKLLFLYGSGLNGKSVFIELMSWITGDYSRKIQTEMLMRQQRNSQGPSPDIVGLQGRRLIHCNETTEGRRLDEARIKELTGGDTLVGRVPYGKFEVEFEPTHKLMIAGNYQPIITDNGFGLWRRIILFPFEQTIAPSHVDGNLLKKLNNEAPGILNWMLIGLNEWRKVGLQVPQVLSSATNAYREDQDLLNDWIDEHCDTGQGYTANKERLYQSYKHWCRNSGYSALSVKRFSRQLTQKGFAKAPDNRTVLGLQLNKEGLYACLPGA